jgi:hypothetical protein
MFDNDAVTATRMLQTKQPIPLALREYWNLVHSPECFPSFHFGISQRSSLLLHIRLVGGPLYGEEISDDGRLCNVSLVLVTICVATCSR